jgi:hypothetical protein
MTRSNIIPLHRVVELPVRTLDEIAREAEGQHKPDLYEALRHVDHRPPLGERLVRFFRRNSFSVGVVCYVVAVAVGMYFAFQIGRGVWL